MLTDWLAEHDRWPSAGVRIHSRNNVGVPVMLATIDRYSPFPLGYSTARGTEPAGGWPPALM
jgi:hypothetical protein